VVVALEVTAEVSVVVTLAAFVTGLVVRAEVAVVISVVTVTGM
jgi:hypothetical protein